MVTIYELLEVEEDASKEEIEKAYSRLVLEFRQDIKFDAETNKENEMIVNRLKLAYEILTDDEKRKRYDRQLAEQRAENLIRNIPVKEENKEKEYEVEKQEKNDVPNVKNEIKEESKNESFAKEDDSELSEQEKKEIRKAAQQEFKQKLKKAKKAEEEYNEAYNKAYNDYLRKMGYQVKEPWTLKRVKRLLISILIIIVTIFIMWCIPPIRKICIELYENNFIIKALVDLIKSIFGAFKGE